MYFYIIKENKMTTVNHARFGTGTIISQDDSNITIDFCGEIKTLIKKYAGLTHQDGTPIFEVKSIEKKAKKTKAEKRMDWERTLTEDDKRKLRFENADGTRDDKAYEYFLKRREAAKWGSISW